MGLLDLPSRVMGGEQHRDTFCNVCTFILCGTDCRYKVSGHNKTLVIKCTSVKQQHNVLVLTDSSEGSKCSNFDNENERSDSVKSFCRLPEINS